MNMDEPIVMFEETKDISGNQDSDPEHQELKDVPDSQHPNQEIQPSIEEPQSDQTNEVPSESSLHTLTSDIVNGDSDGDPNEIIDAVTPKEIFINGSFACNPVGLFKNARDFTECYQAVVLSLTVEKSLNIQLGYRLKAIIIHRIQTAIINVFSKFCKKDKQSGHDLMFLLGNFTYDYFQLITTHFKQIYKESKPFFDAYFADDERKLSYEMIKSLFLESVSVKNNKNAVAKEPTHSNSDDNCQKVFAGLHITTVTDSHIRGFATYIYQMIERAIEQRSIIVAYTLLYLYNILMHGIQIATKACHLKDELPLEFLHAIISGELIINAQPVVDYLFDTETQFERKFPVECALIIQATHIAGKLNDPRNKFVDTKEILSETLLYKPQSQTKKESASSSSSSSSSSSFFGGFFG
jgi:hypothetical protein